MSAHIEPTRTRQNGTRVTSAKSGAEIIEACRAILAKSQYAKINGHMVDLFSASAIVKVHDAINESNRTKFLTLPVERMARIAFSLLK
jgi:hypothetical protein